ncbi:MAG: UDP-N-acetyl-D-glucosamine dehydrogenase, partial [Candidatus Omnitrophica bacterium]|nr:UDP-N-acetyl-D-glucosamine dehydrogenase [Candidatus Omnitrophota bacterium]
GPGCGGHCIPLDPLYLSWKAKEHGFETRFIDLASSVNEELPGYTTDRVDSILGGLKKGMGKSNILVIGVAYKKDVKDLRESPAIEIISILQKRRAKVSFYDPYFPYLKINGINLKRSSIDKKALKKYDCAVLVTDHSSVDYKYLAKHIKLILDTRNVFGKLGIKSKKIVKL